MRIFLFILLCSCSLIANAQNNSQPNCDAPEAKQFDFWAGDWNLTWNDSLHGSNHVEKVFGSCVTQENFNDPNTHYLGKSWSSYNAGYKMWQQTWVDSQGGYIALTGGMQGDSMVLVTEEKKVPANISPTGKIISRMVYYHITHQSFDWSWQGSTDGGKTWVPNWDIHYERKK